MLTKWKPHIIHIALIQFESNIKKQTIIYPFDLQHLCIFSFWLKFQTESKEKPNLHVDGFPILPSTLLHWRLFFMQKPLETTLTSGLYRNLLLILIQIFDCDPRHHKHERRSWGDRRTFNVKNQTENDRITLLSGIKGAALRLDDDNWQRKLPLPLLSLYQKAHRGCKHKINHHQCTPEERIPACKLSFTASQPDFKPANDPNESVTPPVNQCSRRDKMRLFPKDLLHLCSWL